MKNGSEAAVTVDQNAHLKTRNSRTNQDTESVCPEMPDRQMTLSEYIITPETPLEELPMFMEVKEVAAYWRVNPKTVYDMIRRGELRVRKIGRVNRINRNDVVQSSQGNDRVSHSPRRIE